MEKETIKTYSVRATCNNCQQISISQIPQETPVKKFPCPNCKCKALETLKDPYAELMQDLALA